MLDLNKLFTCPECGSKDTMDFDASTLMDRAFEDVMFAIKKVYDIESGDLVGFAVTGKDEDADYLADFNMVKHSEVAHEHLLGEGALRNVYCPTCQEGLE